MGNTVQIILCLMSLVWGHSSWADEVASDNFEECITEPVFESKVCTLQANRNAPTGVILIHGLGGSVDDWKDTLPELAGDFHVLAFDLPGFGKSDKGSKRYSPTMYARLAHFLADRYFRDKPYHIIGHSMGGAIALRFAAQRPLRLQRMVLLDVAGILHPQVISKFQAGSMLERASGVKRTRKYAERVSGRILEQMEKMPVLPTDIVNTALGRDVVLQGGPEKIAALELAAEDFSYAVSSANEPTLIMWGDKDLTVPLRTGRVLAARMPHARLEIVPDAGHVPMQDQAALTNALIRKHLLASGPEPAASRQAPQSADKPESDRVGTCSSESGLEFVGDYRSIELRDCSNIVIRAGRVGRLSVHDSSVTLLDIDIAGKDEGLYAYNSDVTITNGGISGAKIAIKAESSRLDLAGVHLRGGQHAVQAMNSKIVFSISRVRSPQREGSIHEYRNMTNEAL